MRFRRFIFWIFVGFFIVASIIAILFAEGLRLNLKSLKFIKTGGIFIKTSQSGAKIYVNDKFIEKTTGLLNYSRLVSGLIPGHYNIFVYKEGYYPWNKTIEVKNGLVVEINHILLFPLNLQKVKIAQLTAQTMSDFAVKNETIEIRNVDTKTIKTYDFGGKLISSVKFKVATSSGEIISPDEIKKVYVSENKIWIDYLKDEKEEPIKKPGEPEVVSEYEAPIKFFNWLNDSQHIIWFANSELGVTERDDRGGKRNTIKFYLNIASPVYFDRENSDFYFFESDGKKEILYKINLGI